MQYRVFPKIQATALLMRGALKLELVHTLYPVEPAQDNLDCRVWNLDLSQDKASAGAAQQMT